MDALKLVFHPTSDQINSFLPFLKDEYEKNGQGIYCNWKTILSRLKKDQIITLHLNDKPISFVTWYRNDKVVEMEIIWTLPSYRGKGYGYEFQQLLFRVQKRGDVAMTLYCATKDGLSLAKRSGFIPQNNNADFNNENILFGQEAAYFKILRNTEPLFFENEDLIIKCYEKYSDESSFYGEICLSADFEKRPVYYFVDGRWECKIVYNGDVIRQSKMKYILSDLKIPLYNYTIAYLNHNITVPKHWIK